MISAQIGHNILYYIILFSHDLALTFSIAKFQKLGHLYLYFLSPIHYLPTCVAPPPTEHVGIRQPQCTCIV